MIYRLLIVALFAVGLLAGLTLGIFYFVVDRGPTTWNRAARVITGLIAAVILTYGAGTLQLLGGAVPQPPTNVVGWSGVVSRVFAVAWLWYLVGVYLTPHRRNGTPDLGESGASVGSPE